ncbi:MAG: sulfite exporter TauE/SafE family protein [Armatimonadetes bacterium]|nr:sulfite exporter TauE/SafE family protein [Armatimonadota bacterium]
MRLVDSQQLFLAPLLGLVIGFLVGLTGLGGGALMTPALIIFLRLPPLVAVGTDLIYASVTKLVGCYQHVRLGNVNWHVVLYLSLGSLPGAFVGTLAMGYLSHMPGISLDLVLERLLGVVLTSVALLTLWRTYGRSHPVPEEERELVLRRRWMVLLGLLVGILVALTSIGSGTVVTLFLLVCFTMSVPRVVGTDLAHAVVLLSFAGASHFFQGNVNLRLVGLLLAGSVPGVLIGAHFTGRLPERAVKTVLACLLLATGVRLI